MSQQANRLNSSQGYARVSLWIMVVISVGSVLSSLDLFVVNLAFSAIRDSFPGATNQAMSWVLSAYSIAFAAFLVPSGRLADIYGRKRIFKAGLLAFAIASLGCALAPDVVSLIIARSLKGIGAALMIPTSLGLLLAAYPKERHKQTIGIWAAAGSVAAAFGPTLGGILVDIDWRLIFLINLPVAIPALLLTKHLSESKRIKSAFPDILGSILLIAGIAFLVAGISYAPDWGWNSKTLWLTLGGSVISLAVFARRCMTVSSPALELRVFQAPSFTVATVGMSCFYVGFAIMLLGATLYMTQVWSWDPMLAGAAIGISPGVAILASLLIGRTAFAPTQLTMVAGLLFLTSGTWWFVSLGAESNYITGLLPGLILTGAAAGIGQTGFIAGGTSALPADQYATGTGVINTSRQIGAAIGVAIFVSVSGTALNPDQYKIGWLVMAAAGLMASLSALLLRKKHFTNGR